MIKIFVPLAGLALCATGVQATSTPKTDARSGPSELSRRAAPTIMASPDAERVAAWIAASGDNHALPYAVIDKNSASLLLYDGRGRPVAQVPVLIGIAPGDDATPGVGSKTLGEIGPAEKTTPAGRFLAKFGYAAGRQKVLWVDYTNSVAIHPIPGDAAKREMRRERLLSPEPDDNRITFGCINVPRAFYGSALRPLFQKKGGYVYILPDTKPLEDVFPRLRVHALTAHRF
ncbi:hypothetical protein [Sphingomonas sp. S-NIH.Pt15_0812]|uniref:hypothetical protein n=1 Tax=Sphingomonas sp. S-NIH.Pt15_0812 TaxID=1920129 RepID=UPI000F7EAD6C|nr:hypothetical protein [Sphingomonas sp. S-NIH.Pt15_0812]RSU52287.1 hypothetical protein BRX43_04865 [Sphingomonas sp. S-NIH.Pt15_0812]